MKDFDQILDECLTRLAGGAASLDECLARYPEHAAQLKPLLQSMTAVEGGRNVRPSPAFKARARAKLTAYMQAHPHQRAGTFSPLVWRAAVSLAVLVVAFLATGTVFAQSALPGQSLYGWKLSSEQAWRAVAPDRVAVDLSLSDRRVSELKAVASDPAREAQALGGYVDVLAHLKSESDAQNNAKISHTLKSHQEQLSAAGISVPELDNYLSSPSPGPIPAVTPAPTLHVPILPDVLPSTGPKPLPTAGVPTLKP